MLNRLSDSVVGMFYTLAAFIAWGVLPIYWYFLKGIPAYEIFAHRILWSFLFAAFILLLIGGWPQVKKVLANRVQASWVFLAAVLISANWFIFIWAVTSNHVIGASLGYYINPLLSIALGVIIFREKLNHWKIISLLLAATGVLIMTIQFGQVPWVALIIASTFALYGVVKKVVKVEPLVSVTLETLFILPIVLSYLLFLQVKGTAALGHVSILETIFLLGAGAVTALPLLWFSKGAQKIPLSTIGFLQYINPTIQLLVGIYFFHETFTNTHLISFGFIWVALTLFSLSQINFKRYLQFRPRFKRTSPVIIQECEKSSCQ
ncbi:EamA family transporter RarD [Pseudalkalibacillus sp. R45]|uniref:EamA family transporter RarD n=1 Tax=Pseudalkalibacillus sp. R45 TaxID=3457433 RepID=UPI003FCCD3D7